MLVAVTPNQGGSARPAPGGQGIPAAASDRGGMVFDQTGLLEPGEADGDVPWPQSLAADGGPVVVTVFFDFMCPWCGVFEQTQAGALDQMLASGDIVIESRPVSILDRFSNGTQFSTRSAAAAFAVAQGSPEHYFEFVEAMMAEGTQPAENTPGLTNEQIAAIAEGLGVPQAVQDQIISGAYVDYVAVATERASQ
ncbi:MAG TPA: thioredoxin domain-containing protein, partial [Actinotalea sp.]|nr:thioredoxin domain-containing protein [Actinotalea sp.]